jgi:hypothetical protein
VDKTPKISSKVSKQDIIASHKSDVSVNTVSGLELSTWGAVLAIHLALGRQTHRYPYIYVVEKYTDTAN